MSKTPRSARSARIGYQSARSNESTQSVQVQEFKKLRKVMISKSVKEFRKQMESVLTNKRRKMQDIEI